MTADCPRCGDNQRLRHREFSDQALAALIKWNEIAKADIGKPICDNCYDELRDALIERAEELDPKKPAKKKGKSKKKAG